MLFVHPLIDFGSYIGNEPLFGSTLLVARINLSFHHNDIGQHLEDLRHQRDGRLDEKDERKIVHDQVLEIKCIVP